MIISYNDVFGSESNMGCYPKPVRIKTEGTPISARQYPIAVKYQTCIDEEIDKMLKIGVIEPIKDCQLQLLLWVKKTVVFASVLITKLPLTSA